jgi:hypothetical protein
VDRDDARFVAAALDSRMSSDREALDQLAASSAIRLTALAARIKTLAADWPIAERAALELETIAIYGARTADAEAHPDLKIFVDKLLDLANEPARPIAPRNRFERRMAVSGRTALKQRRTRAAELSRIHAASAP